jgi:hypothetical protein
LRKVGIIFAQRDGKVQPYLDVDMSRSSTIRSIGRTRAGSAAAHVLPGELISTFALRLNVVNLILVIIVLLAIKGLIG